MGGGSWRKGLLRGTKKLEGNDVFIILIVRVVSLVYIYMTRLIKLHTFNMQFITCQLHHNSADKKRNETIWEISRATKNDVIKNKHTK